MLGKIAWSGEDLASTPCVELPPPPDQPLRSTHAEQKADALRPTIFHEGWWLDLATDGRFEEVEVRDGGRTVGLLPFRKRSIAGLAYCDMPPLAHFMGPATEGDATRPSGRLRRDAITRELMGKLPKGLGFRQKLHRGIDDVLVFQEERYSTSVQFTLEIPRAAPDRLWAQLRDKTRNAIRGNMRRFEEASPIDPQEFARAYRTSHVEKHGVCHYDERQLSRLCSTFVERGRGRLIGISDKEGGLRAAVAIIWDATSAYYFLSLRTPRSDNGDISRLLWEGILAAHRQGLIFDFGGVGTNGSRVFFNGFGGAFVPRYVVNRTIAPLTIFRALAPRSHFY